jgi:phenylalanyl-tRNA synthetase alpha chain
VIEGDLKAILTGLARNLFGEVEMRWKKDHFPFTDPSFELEVMYNGDWLEVWRLVYFVRNLAFA